MRNDAEEVVVRAVGSALAVQGAVQVMEELLLQHVARLGIVLMLPRRPHARCVSGLPGEEKLRVGGKRKQAHMAVWIE